MELPYTELRKAVRSRLMGKSGIWFATCRGTCLTSKRRYAVGSCDLGGGSSGL